LELQRIALVPYPFFPDLRSAGLNDEHPAMAGVTTMTMPWSSPVEPTAETLEGREITWLARTSAAATTRSDASIEPDLVTPDGMPVWTPGSDPKERTLALAVAGKFPSYFADLPNPTLQNGNAGGDDSGRTLKASITDGRVVVLGSSEIVSDLMLTLASQTQSEQHAGNPQLVQNLIDWSLQDTDLLQIRTGGAFARTLSPMDAAGSRATEIRTWLMVLVPVLLVVMIPRVRRRNTQPLPDVALPENT
jgi:ABC-2 type transport system permease protein